MMNAVKFKRTVGGITVLSGIIGFTSYFLVAGSVSFNFEFFSNPSLIFSMPDVNIVMLRWSMITDLFGYYLLLLPFIFFMHEWLLNKSAWRKLFTFCGTAYVMAGAIGAAILAVTWPAFLTKYPGSPHEQQETIKLLFESFSLMVGNGIWNLFDTLVCGVWMIGIGVYIKRVKSFLGWFTVAVGIISLLDGFGNMLELSEVSDLALNLFLFLAPLWAIFIGFAVMRNSFSLEKS
ncbi:MAG TPA: hypothetical protein PKM27_03500 [Saprospiraceae bacterium]|nr:hypothetical protein [Saprospiraceae bacterium]HNT20527.1 hypothetical protein [Saprospiraceae bacterium]